MSSIPCDIDVVYTWVNDRDRAWQAMHREASGNRRIAAGEHPSVYDPARYTNRDELYYSVQSVRKYAPWVRRIYIVTNCRLPAWAGAIDNLVRVDHATLFPDPKDLPTFNSHAIETVLHRIEGLSEHFLYFNDDVFLLRPCRTEDFHDDADKIHYFPSRHNIPDGPARAELRPVDNGAINAVALLRHDFDFRPKKKLHHAPFALRRSILKEIAARYPREVATTRAHAFRSPADLAMATTMHAYYAACTGRGTARQVRARYVDIGDWRFLGLVHPLSPLMRGKYDFLCLNEVNDMRYGRGLRDAMVRRVMHRLS